MLMVLGLIVFAVGRLLRVTFQNNVLIRCAILPERGRRDCAKMYKKIYYLPLAAVEGI
jgi:hypothetical protein